MNQLLNFRKILLFCLLLIFISTPVTFWSCKKDDPNDNKPDTGNNTGVTAEKTNVKTFEIVNIRVNPGINDKYSASFGSQTIDLLKTSDSTLTFYVPDVADGTHVLKFELAEINFSVTKTPEVNPAQMVTEMLSGFDSKISALNPVTNEEKAEVDSMKIFSRELMKAFNSLTEEQKRQTMLFYEANKAVFIAASNDVYNNLDAPTSLGKQSDCPRGNGYKAFYDCTSANLSNSYSNFKESSKEFVKMIGMAGAMGGVALKMSALGPVALGITAVGMSLPLSMAIYLGATEVWPAWVKLRNNTYDYLKAPWIFREEIFNNIKTEFSNDSYTDLNLEAGFRTISNGDADVTPNTGTFINALSSLNTYWEKISSLFGKVPTFQSNQKNVNLIANEITISNISNPYVKLFEQDGEKVKFKSTSGNEETFNYNIKVTKEGFVKEKTISAHIKADFDSTEIYKASALGFWTVSNKEQSNGTVATLELFANGSGRYKISGNSTTYPITWYIKKSENEYRLYESGFWHPGFDNLNRDKLTYSVKGFNTYNSVNQNVALEYIKN